MTSEDELRQYFHNLSMDLANTLTRGIWKVLQKNESTIAYWQKIHDEAMSKYRDEQDKNLANQEENSRLQSELSQAQGNAAYWFDMFGLQKHDLIEAAKRIETLDAKVREQASWLEECHKENELLEARVKELEDNAENLRLEEGEYEGLSS